MSTSVFVWKTSTCIDYLSTEAAGSLSRSPPLGLGVVSAAAAFKCFPQKAVRSVLYDTAKTMATSSLCQHKLDKRITLKVALKKT